MILKLFKKITAVLEAREKRAAANQDNAAVFFYGRPPTKTEIGAWVAGAKFQWVPDWSKTRITVVWPDVSMLITIDTKWDRNVQLAGIQGWVRQFSEEEKQTPAVAEFVQKLNTTTTCYGCVITPSFDAEGKAAEVIKKMLAESGGFVFHSQSFYDAQGKRITGMAEDPEFLGLKK